MTQTHQHPFAVVTGASSGIGLELARQFAGNGYDVLMVAEDAGIAEAASSVAAEGCAAEPLRADLSTYEGVEQVVSAIDSRGPLAAIALNAGVGNAGEFASSSLQDDLTLIQTNVVSVVHLLKRVLPGMLQRSDGKVLITSSVAATAPGPYYATYAASKSFLQSFAEAVRFEVKDKGVTITALMPGPTDTEFFERAGMQDTPVDSGPKDDPAEVAKDGYEALMAGKDHVVAGSVKNKVQTTASGLLPDRAAAGMHATQTKPADSGD